MAGYGIHCLIQLLLTYFTPGYTSQLHSTTAFWPVRYIRMLSWPAWIVTHQPMVTISIPTSNSVDVHNALTRRSQHSQECKDSCQHCLCDSWPWPLTFWLQNKRVSRTHTGTFLSQIGWSQPHRRFLKYRAEKQTDTQTNGGKNPTLMTATSMSNYLNDILNKSALERLSAFDEPHSNDVICQWDSIVTVPALYTHPHICTHEHTLGSFSPPGMASPGALLTQVQSVQCSDGPLFGKIANYGTWFPSMQMESSESGPLWKFLHRHLQNLKTAPGQADGLLCSADVSVLAVSLKTKYLRMHWTNLHQTFPHGVHLPTK